MPHSSGGLPPGGVPPTGLPPSTPAGSPPPGGFSGKKAGLIGGGVLATIALIAALLVGTGVIGGSKTATTTDALTVDLTSATTPGQDPFGPSFAVDPDPVPSPTATPEATASASPTTQATVTQPATQPTGGKPVVVRDKVYPFPKVSNVVGDSPGLFGGTRRTTSCNQKQMVSYLKKNPAKAKVWISTQNSDKTLRYSGGKLTMNNFDEYIGTLTPLVLRFPTYLNNHGFVNGNASLLPEFLDAGNAVLVDQYGTPRARCFCGNPLTVSERTPKNIRFRNTPKTAFDPSNATVLKVQPTTKKVTDFKVVDVTTGEVFRRPTGTTGAGDTKTNLAASTPAATTPTPTPLATASAAATPGTVFNGPFGVTAPAGFVYRADSVFTGYPDVPVIEFAKTDVDVWRDYAKDPSEAGFSISDLTRSSTDPSLFSATVAQNLQRPQCPVDAVTPTYTWGNSNGDWVGEGRRLGPCTDTDQITELITLTRSSDRSTVALLLRGPSASFDQLRDTARETLLTFQR